MRLRLQRGFTLIELLVALVLTDIGLLALVGGSSAVVRRHTSTRARTQALRLAANRVQSLAAALCGANPALTGSATVTAGTELWTVTPAAPGVREIADSVSYLVEGDERHVTIRTRTSC
jgi:prepilin-type N-terminal cleavage/methylation domain-containing protein